MNQVEFIKVYSNLKMMITTSDVIFEINLYYFLKNWKKINLDKNLNLNSIINYILNS
jgi:hypothetical protein